MRARFRHRPPARAHRARAAAAARRFRSAARFHRRPAAAARLPCRRRRRRLRAGARNLGGEPAAAILNLGAELFGFERLRRPRRAAGQPRGHRRLQIVELGIEQFELLEPFLGIEKVDPGERRRQPDVLRRDRFVGARDPDFGQRARRTRPALGGMGEFLADTDHLHREIVAVEAARVGAGDREILDGQIEFGIGQPVGRDRRRLGGVDPRFASAQFGRLGFGQPQRGVECQRLGMKRRGQRDQHGRRKKIAHDVPFCGPDKTAPDASVPRAESFTRRGVAWSRGTFSSCNRPDRPSSCRNRTRPFAPVCPSPRRGLATWHWTCSVPEPGGSAIHNGRPIALGQKRERQASLPRARQRQKARK